MAVRLSSSGPGTVAGHLEARPAAGTVEMLWLGQAGFMLRSAQTALVIDPYLSDSLAEKYRGREFAHQRMMPVPVAPERLTGVGLVLATHGHTDHLDPGTLPALAIANPEAIFAVPRAHRDLALTRGVPAERAVSLNSGDTIDAGGVPVAAIASAHESREQDTDGNDLYLGYVIRIGGLNFYHSGDSVPYEGLARALREAGVDVVMLPVNGRDEFRRSRGVPGNFTADEAFTLAKEAGASWLVAHHFGMFEFNTIAPEDAVARFAAANRNDGGAPATLVPEIGVLYRFTRG